MWPFVPIDTDGSLSPVVLLTTPGNDWVRGTVNRVFENVDDDGCADTVACVTAAARSASAASSPKRLSIESPLVSTAREHLRVRGSSGGGLAA
jgi:hypothetical protein